MEQSYAVRRSLNDNSKWEVYRTIDGKIVATYAASNTADLWCRHLNREARELHEARAARWAGRQGKR